MTFLIILKTNHYFFLASIIIFVAILAFTGFFKYIRIVRLVLDVSINFPSILFQNAVTIISSIQTVQRNILFCSFKGKKGLLFDKTERNFLQT